MELAARTKVSTRSAENWLSGATGISAEALTLLLRSDEGLEFLEVVMADEQPAWWRAFKRQMRLSELRKLQEAQRRELEMLERQAADH